MFEVIEKETGKRRTVYAVQGNRFTVGVESGFVICDMVLFAPVPQEGGPVETVETTPCTFTTAQNSPTDLDELLAGIASGEIPVKLGDMISTRLLDGTEVDLIVTDQDDKTVRVESRDCLGIHTSARNLGGYLKKVYDLLPAALKNRVVEVERVHLDSDGYEFTERCKLFVPAASEIFSPDECYGDKDLYRQLEWYKDVHNRVRADRKGGDSHWYWTSSPGSSNSNNFCCVSGSGNAYSVSASSAIGVAPFGCIISKVS